jgi:hypothetical protein
VNIRDAVAKLAEYGDIPEKDAPSIATALENKFGKLAGKFLGAGGKGFAWMVGHDWVFKLTTDEQEAWAASALLGLRHPNVGQYKHVAKIANTGLYAIIQEYAGEPIHDPAVRLLIDKFVSLNSEQIIAALKDLVEKSSHPLWEQLLSGIQFLRDHGVKNYDLQADNVVQKGDIYKIIDVGIGDPDPMHLGKINLEQKMDIAFSGIEIINKPFLA